MKTLNKFASLKSMELSKYSQERKLRWKPQYDYEEIQVLADMTNWGLDWNETSSLKMWEIP